MAAKTEKCPGTGEPVESFSQGRHAPEALCRHCQKMVRAVRKLDGSRQLDYHYRRVGAEGHADA